METVNTPPLDVAELRSQWQAIRSDARSLKPAQLPSPEKIGEQWEELAREATRQERSVFEISSVMALSAVRTLPDKVRWLSSSARVSTVHTGKYFSAAILDHYSQTLSELRQVGYLTYSKRQLSPYLAACVSLFSPDLESLTERLLKKLQRRPL